MLKRICLIFTYISLLLLVLTGCYTTDAAQTENISNSYSTTMREEDIPASQSLQELTENTTYERYAEAENISFDVYKCIDDISFLAFSFNNNQETFFGFTVAERDEDQYKLSWFEVFPVFQNKPVTVMRWGGSHPGREDQVINAVAGYVNGETIEEIILYYSDSVTKEIKLDEEQKVFFDFNQNSESSLLKFECKSSNGRIVYQEDYT